MAISEATQQYQIDQFWSPEVSPDSIQETGKEVASRLIEERRQGYEERVVQALTKLEKRENGEEALLTLFGSIYDSHRYLLHELFPDASQEIIIHLGIRQLVDNFYRDQTGGIGIRVYYPKTLDSLDDDLRVRLGWYYFDKNSFRAVYDSKYDERTQWERLMMKPPRYVDGPFLHYFPEVHGPTEQGIALMDAYGIATGKGAYNDVLDSNRQDWNSLMQNHS